MANKFCIPDSVSGDFYILRDVEKEYVIKNIPSLVDFYKIQNREILSCKVFILNIFNRNIFIRHFGIKK